MSTRISGNSLFASATSGLSSSYYYLSLLAGTSSGLTLENILHPDTDSSTASSVYLNSTFAQYLAKNFSKIDTDGDGTITSDDVQSYSTKLYATGLSYSEIAELCSQGGGTLYETVLNNFSEIDANSDGRVTSAEISAFGIEQEKEEMEEKYPKMDLNAMSIFYDTSSATASSTTSTSDDTDA